MNINNLNKFDNILSMLANSVLYDNLINKINYYSCEEKY